MSIVPGKYYRIRVILAHACLWIAVLIALTPVLALVAISLRKGNLAVGVWIPSEISWEHWQRMIRSDPFPVLRWIMNSFKVSLIAAIFLLLLSLTGAYALSRFQLRYRSWILRSLLLLQMFPAILASVAVYSLIQRLGSWIPVLGLDTHGGLILAYLGGISTAIWMIKGYFESLSPEIEEAAQLDGASPLQILIQILLPTSYPILVTVFLLSFITGFNEYPLASILLFQEKNLTLAVGLRFFLQDQQFLWGDFAAAALLGGLPILLLFLLMQRFLLSGFREGSNRQDPVENHR